jgi:hypothetical protein
MKNNKKTFIHFLSFVLILFFVNLFSTFVFASEENLIFPKLSVSNFTLDKDTYNTGEVVKGTFDITNTESYNIPDLKYTVSLAGDYHPTGLLPTKFYSIKDFDKLYLKAGETKNISFEYLLPVNYSGEGFGVQLRLFTGAGIKLGRYNNRILIKGESVFLNIEEVGLYNSNKDKYAYPIIKDNSGLYLSAVIKNDKKIDINFVPTIKIYNKNIDIQKFEQIKFDSIIVKASSSEKIELDLKEIIKKPGVYSGVFSLIDKNNNSISEDVLFEYSVYGDIITIYNVSLNKDYIKKGEEFSLKMYYSIFFNELKSIEGKTFTKIIATTLDDKKVGEYIGDINYSGKESIEIPIKALVNTNNIKVDISIYNNKNQLISSYKNTIFDNRVAESNYEKVFIYILSIVLALIVIFTILKYKKWL